MSPTPCSAVGSPRGWPAGLDAAEVLADLVRATHRLNSMRELLGGTGHSLEDCAALVAEDVLRGLKIRDDLLAAPSRNARQAIVTNKLRWKARQVRDEHWQLAHGRVMPINDEIDADHLRAGPELALIIAEREAERELALDRAVRVEMLALRLKGHTLDEIGEIIGRKHRPNINRTLVRCILDLRRELLLEPAGQAAEAFHKRAAWANERGKGRRSRGRHRLLPLPGVSPAGERKRRRKQAEQERAR